MPTTRIFSHLNLCSRGKFRIAKYMTPIECSLFLNGLTLLIPGFLDPHSTGGGTVPPLRKVVNVADMRTKFGKMVYCNTIYTIGYFFHFHYIHDVTMTS